MIWHTFGSTWLSYTVNIKKRQCCKCHSKIISQYWNIWLKKTICGNRQKFYVNHDGAPWSSPTDSIVVRIHFWNWWRNSMYRARRSNREGRECRIQFGYQTSSTWVLLRSTLWFKLTAGIRYPFNSV